MSLRINIANRMVTILSKHDGAPLHTSEDTPRMHDDNACAYPR